jgi:NADH-quinone oxidoreductase subunit J
MLYTTYLFPFELTSALLITAALGAMVFAFTEPGKAGRLTQRERVEARFRGTHPSPLPGPGVFATMNSVATPALLPDGSPAPESLSALLESTGRDRLADDVRSVAGAGADPPRRGLPGPVPPTAEEGS